MAAERLGGRKLPILLWLIILNIVVLNNFSNMRVVFGLGLWWITLGLIANSVAAHPAPHRVEVPAGAPQRVPFLARRPKIAAPESKVRLPQPDLGRPRVGLPAVGAVASFQIREEWTGSAESVS